MFVFDSIQIRVSDSECVCCGPNTRCTPSPYSRYIRKASIQLTLLADSFQSVTINDQNISELSLIQEEEWGWWVRNETNCHFHI